MSKQPSVVRSPLRSDSYYDHRKYEASLVTPIDPPMAPIEPSDIILAPKRHIDRPKPQERRHTVTERTSDEGRTNMFGIIVLASFFLSMFVATGITVNRGGDLYMFFGWMAVCIACGFVLAVAVANRGGQWIGQMMLIVGHNLYSLFDRWCTHRADMARIRADREHKAAQAHFNAVMRQQQRLQIQAQVQTHSRIQSDRNQLANYQPEHNAASVTSGYADNRFETFDLDDTEYQDTARSKLLDFLLMLYERDDMNEFVNIKPDGYIKKGVVVPWSKRGGMNAEEKAQVLTLLDAISQYKWLLRQEGRMPWQLNTKVYRRCEQAIDIIDYYDTI